jgi:hypothetical protein
MPRQWLAPAGKASTAQPTNNRRVFRITIIASSKRVQGGGPNSFEPTDFRASVRTLEREAAKVKKSTTCYIEGLPWRLPPTRLC